MPSIAEAERIALGLSKLDRGKLVSKLIISLGSPFEEEDDWIEEAKRRSREMDEGHDTVISHEEFMSSFERYRRQ